MNFLKTSFWASLSTGVTMLCGLITTKYVAVIIGPQGMAYVGQFTNATMMLSFLASAACGSGVVKYVSEYKEEAKRRVIISSSLALVLSCTLVVSLVCIVFSYFLSKLIFDTPEFTIVFIVFGSFLVFSVFNNIVTSVLNALGKIHQMAILNITMAVANIAFLLFGKHFWGIKGVLLANITSSAVMFYLFYTILKKTGLAPSWPQIRKPDPAIIRLLLGFSLMTVVSGILAPTVQLFIRTKLLHNLNPFAAGLWQANTRLSDYYLNFVYAVMGVYYLPKLSQLKEKADIKKELLLGYLRIMPLVLLITISVWLMRDLIVKYLLSHQFIEMLSLMKWQLFGDVIKIASWILAYLVIAKAMKKAFILTEIGFAVVSTAVSYVFINHFGLVGTVYAFSLNSFLYLIAQLVIVWKYIL